MHSLECIPVRRSCVGEEEVTGMPNWTAHLALSPAWSPGGASGSVGDEGVGTEKRRGRCKWFNVAKGWGFITPDDGGQDIFVHQSVIVMSGFRSLGEGEEVEFECKTSDKGLEATLVTGPDGSACVGSQRRPVAKKRFRKIRCYNCGEFANHIAAKCTLGPQPKRCHHCKSTEHLIAECPNRRKSQEESEESETSRSKPVGESSTTKAPSEKGDNAEKKPASDTQSSTSSNNAKE
ncbi:protein lin-28 homolog [Homalodisca vitripennis]|nr:protein lin-28 homolog [Homalodisca vitripennis]